MRRVQRAIRRTGFWTLGIVLGATAVWGVLALLHFDHAPPRLRGVLAWSFAAAALATAAAAFSARVRAFAAVGYALVFVLLLWRWSAIEPSNDRDWVPENARLPSVTVDGDRVTIRNVRNFDYRTETDFRPAWAERSYDLRRLDGADLVAVYWMGPAIAHVFLSFRFGDDHLAVSIEARKERGEGYSSLEGFFRQYELIYVVADERDVIRLRTNYRRDPPEQVHVYPLVVDRPRLRALFLDYARRIDELSRQPEFYNTLTTNCTTTIWWHAHVNDEHVPWDWRILASGYLPEYLYEAGRLDRSRPFDELRLASLVNARAQAADHAADFSRRIRLPAEAGTR